MVGPEVEQIAQVDSTLPHGQRQLGRAATSPCTARPSARSSWPRARPCPKGASSVARRAPSAAAPASRPSWRRCASGAGPSPTPSSSPASWPSRPRCGAPRRTWWPRCPISGPSVRIGPRPARIARPPPHPRGGRALTSTGPHTGQEQEGRRRMTPDDILKGLYDETMVGNAPAVKDLTNQGLEMGMEPETRSCSRRSSRRWRRSAPGSSAATTSSRRCSSPARPCPARSTSCVRCSPRPAPRPSAPSSWAPSRATCTTSARTSSTSCSRAPAST